VHQTHIFVCRQGPESTDYCHHLITNFKISEVVRDRRTELHIRRTLALFPSIQEIRNEFLQANLNRALCIARVSLVIQSQEHIAFSLGIPSPTLQRWSKEPLNSSYLVYPLLPFPFDIISRGSCTFPMDFPSCVLLNSVSSLRLVYM